MAKVLFVEPKAERAVQFLDSAPLDDKPSGPTVRFLDDKGASQRPGAPYQLPSLQSCATDDDAPNGPCRSGSRQSRSSEQSHNVTTLAQIDPRLLGFRTPKANTPSPRKSVNVGQTYIFGDGRVVAVKYIGFPAKGIPGMPDLKIQLVGVEIVEDPTGFGGKNTGELQYPTGAVDQLFSCTQKNMGLFMSVEDFKKKVLMTKKEYDRREFMDRKMRQSFYTLTRKHYSTRNRQEFLEELDEDPVFFSLSPRAKLQLNNREAVATMCRDLHRCIDLIETHIPNATKELNMQMSEGEKKLYETHVIQELLYRAKQEGLSRKIRMDFGTSRRVNIEALKFTEEEVTFMVKKIAWIRNNIVASAVTDENDAKMAVMGARECLEALTRMLKAAEHRPDHQITNDEVVALRSEHFKF